MPDHFYLDDSKQNSPSRQGMGSLIAAGGLYVPGDMVLKLETELASICDAFGFPDGEEFKWSPGPRTWMHDNVVGEARSDLFHKVLRACSDAEASAIVCVDDKEYARATGATSHELDVISLLFERIERVPLGSHSVTIVMDRYGGNNRTDSDFIRQCLATIRSGTKFMTFNRIAEAPLSADSCNHRLLQTADLITSCTTAVVSGSQYELALNVFDQIIPLFRRHAGLAGGVGLKIHPDYKYRNLNYWLLGENVLRKGSVSVLLPDRSSQYAVDPMVEWGSAPPVIVKMPMRIGRAPTIANARAAG